MSLDEFVSKFNERIPGKNIVVFSGAGMSTASGIRDFRGENGLYKESVDAECILSSEFFKENPKVFYEFFREYLMIDESIQPNDAHKLLKEYEDEDIVSSIITQNIDGLDKVVGSRRVIELHGNANRFYCVGCKKKYNISDIKEMDTVPICPACGSIIRPDIVLYNEELSAFNRWDSQAAISQANTMLVLGSTMMVNPASQMVHDFVVTAITRPNRKLFIVNKGETYYDHFKDVYKYDGDILDVAHELQRIRKR